MMKNAGHKDKMKSAPWPACSFS